MSMLATLQLNHETKAAAPAAEAIEALKLHDNGLARIGGAGQLRS